MADQSIPKTGEKKKLKSPPRSPRIAISLTPEMQKVFREYAEAQDLSIASSLRMLLIEMLPSIQELTKAINRTKTEPEAALDDMRTFFATQQATIAQAGLDIDTEIRVRKANKPK